MPTIDEPQAYALTVDGDLEVPLRFVTGVAAVAQAAMIRLKTFAGEWFQDLDRGVPMYEDVLGQPFDETKVRAAFYNELIDTEHVITVTEFTLSFNSETRHLTVSWRLKTVFGDTEPDTLELDV